MSVSAVFRLLAIPALALCIAGCARSAGEPAKGFLDSSLQAAYVPLSGKINFFRDGRAAATVIAPGIAATNAHNANIIPETDVIGISRDYDLLYFRTSRMQVPPTAEPWVGEMVIAYGEGAEGELREARGIVRSLNSPVLAQCPDCPIQQVMTFEAGAGEGFSGGPVADASNGRVVGIVFGYNDMKDGSRLMYAYDMSRVSTELSRLRKAPSAPAAKQP